MDLVKRQGFAFSNTALFFPPLLGQFFSCILYGIVLTLTHHYFQLYTEPKFWKSKVWIVFVVLLLAGQNITQIYFECRLLAVHWGEFDYLATTNYNEFIGITTISLILQIQAQLFLLYRAWQFTRFLRLPAVYLNVLLFGGTVVILGANLAGLLATYNGVGSTYLSLSGRRTATYVWLASSFVIDAALMAFLVLELRTTKKLMLPHPTLGNAQMIIERLLVLVVTSGFLVTIVQLSALAAFIWQSEYGSVFDQWSEIPLVPLPSIYTISFLMVLSNPRAAKTPQSSGDVEASFPRTRTTGGNGIGSHHTASYNAVWGLNHPPSTIVIVPADQLSSSRTDSGTRDRSTDKSHSVSFETREVSESEDTDHGLSKEERRLPSIPELRERSMGPLVPERQNRIFPQMTDSSSSRHQVTSRSATPRSRHPPASTPASSQDRSSKELSDGRDDIRLDGLMGRSNGSEPRSQDVGQGAESGMVTQHDYYEGVDRYSS
ncbi:hypothetical protein BT69DRAFT_1348483 [Atractiella rhizophila]|nr:hypothetical protein BT69DRAFT_1348483 [Atractiella rhizophila]